MAYVSQEDKKRLAPGIKAVLKKYGMKGTIAVRHHMSLVVTLKSGKLDLIGSAQRHNDQLAARRGEESYPVGDYLQVNHFWADKWAEETGDIEIGNFYNELVAAMKGDQFFDESDAMTDYFHCSHYLDIDAGKWNKPYVLEA